MSSKIKLPPFNVMNKNFYWSSHTIPYNMHFILDIRGPLDPSRLKEALLQTMMDIPVLRSIIKEGLFFTKRKVLKKINMLNPDSLLVVQEDANPNIDSQKMSGYIRDFLYNIPLEVERNVPIKSLLVRKNEHEWLMFIKIFHSTCDGYGAYLIISRIFQKYNILGGSENKIQIPPEPSSYSLRNLKKLLKDRAPSKEDRDQDKLLEKKIGFVRDGDAPQGQEFFGHITVPEDKYREIIAFCRQKALTINNFFVAVIGRIMNTVLSARNSDYDVVSIGQVTSIRKYLGVKGGINNFISPFSLSLSKELFDSFESLVQGIADQTTKIFERKDFIEGLFKNRRVKYTPTKIMKKYMSAYEMQFFYHPLSTTAVSNLGDLSGILEAPGGCTINNALSVGSANWSYGHQWIITTYNDVMTLSIPYLNPLLSHDTIQLFIKNFWTEIERVLGGMP